MTVDNGGRTVSGVASGFFRMLMTVAVNSVSILVIPTSSPNPSYQSVLQKNKTVMNIYTIYVLNMHIIYKRFIRRLYRLWSN